MPADDSIFEKALERQMRRRPVDGMDGAAQNEACPDAELLAAYHERSLSDEEMVLWKEHIAGCGRCQEVLAALEATEEISLGGEREGGFTELSDALGGMVVNREGAAVPGAEEKIAPLVMRSKASVSVMRAPPVAARGPRQKRTTRGYWMVAAGTIAAAAVLYVGVARLRHKTPPETAETIATTKTPGAARPGAARPGVAEEPQLSAQNASPQELSTERMRAVPPSVVDRNEKTAGRVAAPRGDRVTADLPSADKGGDLPPKRKAPLSAGAAAAARGASGPETDLKAAAAGSPAAAAPALREEPNAEDAKKRDAPAAKETITIVNEAPPAPVGAPSESVEVSRQKPAPAPSHQKDETAETRAALQVDSQYRANAIGGSRELAKESHLIVAPGGNVVWRVGAAGTIEQSTNAGATWTKQMSGVADQALRSGSAPSEAVCWVVGSAGTILRTVDGGGHWMAVISPLGPRAKKGELGGVFGVDGLHATVWDARNTRQFSTSDGGQSWVRVEKQQK
jgi:hypothetical protein